MDLLGSYNSSDEDNDDGNSKPPTTAKLTSTPLTSTATKPQPKRTTVEARRGKKLVSLHAVLPSHILEQLTKGERDGYDDSSDGSDEGSDDREKKQRKKAKSAAHAMEEAAFASSHPEQDPGIVNFLSALGKAKTSASRTKSEETTTQAAQKKPPPPTKMDAAFLSVTTTSTRRGGGEETPTTSTTNANAPSTPRSQTSPLAGGSSPPPSGYQPLSTSPRTAFHRFAKQPSAAMLSVASISAAPPVPNMTATAAQLEQPPPNMGMAASAQQQSEEESTTTQRMSRKQQKRQLQKALRSGNVDQALRAAGGEDAVQAIEQAQPTAFVPLEDTYAVPTHGVRVAATSLYHPAAGTDVAASERSGGARGKNQINQLMASAANFELQQARRPGASGKSERSGGKRKYGW